MSSYLQELQATNGTPMTIQQMTARQKRYEEIEANKTKIIFESIFGSILLKHLLQKISEQGAASEFSFTVESTHYLRDCRWWINDRYVQLPFTDAVSQEFRDYVEGRLKALFPDYSVACECKVMNTGICWRKEKNLWVGMLRKDAERIEKLTSEKDVLLS